MMRWQKFRSIGGPLVTGDASTPCGVDWGICSFAEVGAGADRRRRPRDLLEPSELADQVGLDVFGVGEHHRADLAVSAPSWQPRYGAEAARRSTARAALG